MIGKERKGSLIVYFRRNPRDTGSNRLSSTTQHQHRLDSAGYHEHEHENHSECIHMMTKDDTDAGDHHDSDTSLP